MPHRSATSPESSLDLDAYFARIGYAGPRTPILETLTGIVAAHVRHIPFEGIDPLLGIPVAALDPETLQDKLVRRRRGGYCFEQNGLLGYVLQELGFSVDALAGRVVWMKDTDTLPAETHQLLRIVSPQFDGPRLVDVGFGGQTPTIPLRHVLDEPQETDHEPFRITRDDSEWRSSSPLTMETLIDGTWRPVYLFSDSARPRIDLEVASWYVSTQPSSHFVTGLNAAIVTDDARWNLRGRHLSIHRRGGGTEKKSLADASEVLDLLDDRFGIDVATIDGLSGAVATVLDS